MTAERTIRIGVASREQIRERTIAIAAGRLKPKPADPKVWITSPKVIAELLNENNLALLRIIQATEPESVSSLARATGRSQGNLSRTLRAMSRYGLVDMVRERNQVRPVAKASHLRLDIALA